MAVTLSLKEPVAAEREAGPAAKRAPARKPWYTRLLEALVEARMRQVEREIARYRSLVPHDEAKAGGYRVSYANDEELPFVR
jgi:hypothetical protein